MFAADSRLSVKWLTLLCKEETGSPVGACMQGKHQPIERPEPKQVCHRAPNEPSSCLGCILTAGASCWLPQACCRVHRRATSSTSIPCILLRCFEDEPPGPQHGAFWAQVISEI